jgi:hypothetical protein
LCRGTRSSNPSPSSGESAKFWFLSGGARATRLKEPGVRGPGQAAGSAETRRARQHHANCRYVSVGLYSSTAVQARRFATVVALVRQARSG